MVLAQTESEIEHLIRARFDDLSPRLQQAARYIVDHPREIALHSMRRVAGQAEVDPSSMVRLAQELGFGGYEEMRERFRAKLLASEGGWARRARRIQGLKPTTGPLALVQEVLDADRRNLDKTFTEAALADIERSTKLMEQARTVYVVGLRSLYPVAFYFHYACRLFMTKTVLLTGTGGTFADDLRLAGPEDALVVFSYRPYARDAVRAVEFAKGVGTKIVAVTDSKLSPIAKRAEAAIIVSNALPSLLPSITPFFAVAQALATVMVLEGGEAAIKRIARTEEQLASFRVYQYEGRRLSDRRD